MIKNKTIKTSWILTFFLLGIFCFFDVAVSRADDGVCGSSNAQYLYTAPTENLCASGDASAVSGSGPWNWTCVGVDCTSGSSQACVTTDNCAGEQLCTAGTWGACVKNDPACGTGYYCSQGQLCSATTGVCVDKCSVCACPQNKPNCNTSNEACESPTGCDPDTEIELVDGSCAKQCSDGTLVYKCSSASPGFQCVGDPSEAPVRVQLKAACPTCACVGTKVCNETSHLCEPNGSNLPDSFNWANVDGKNFLTPTRNQGDTQLCWAYAAVGAVEAKYNIERNITGNNIDLSEASIGMCMYGGFYTGGFPEEALEYMRGESGVVEQTCIQATGNQNACVETCEPRHGFLRYATTLTGEDLFTRVYKYGPTPLIINNGSHAVLMVGWADGGETIYIKNSYGGAQYESIETNESWGNAYRHPQETY